MYNAGLEVLAAVIMNVAIFRDIVPCIPHMNRRFGGKYHLYLQGRKSTKQETSVQQVVFQRIKRRW
jgi:hypothetical protein